MPIKYSIDTERGFRAFTCTGDVGTNDILQTINGVCSSEDFFNSKHALWDFRNCTINISSDEMRKIIDCVQRNMKGFSGEKVALVVDTTLDFGLARMFHLLSEQKVDRPLMVFRDYYDALKWIEESQNE
jgi:hypothetical protein